MTVEDVFTIIGRGTVVIGRIESGTLNVGDEIHIKRQGSAKKTVVTGIEAFRKQLNQANAGDNVGVSLRDVGKEDVHRGDVLMGTDSEFSLANAKIAPREVQLPTELKVPEPGFAIYIGVWFGLYIGLACVLGIFSHLIHLDPGWGVLLAFVLAFPGCIVIGRIVNSRKQERLRARHISDLKASLEAASVHEAESTTSKVIDLAEAGRGTVISLPNVIEQARDDLRIAKTEYSEHAFAPFWDAVQRATLHIATYRKIVSTVNGQAARYYNLLQGRQHDFGPFPVRSEDLPTLATLLEEYRKVVRLGQTDFQFASIYEQYKTRQVLIEGFCTLGEAIENVGHAVTQSLEELEHTMQAGLSEISHQVEHVGERAQEAIGELRSQTAKLDNIQRGRKPRFLGE